MALNRCSNALSQNLPPTCWSEVFVWLVARSLLRGLPEIIGMETGLPVGLAEDPLTCVARGCAALLEDLDVVKQILDTEGGQ